jgi:hypothetical protein
MGVDIELRVWRANLIAQNHQLEQLFDDDLSASPPRLLRQKGSVVCLI